MDGNDMGQQWYKLEDPSRELLKTNLSEHGFIGIEINDFFVILDPKNDLMTSIKFLSSIDMEGEEDVCMFYAFNCNVLNRRKIIELNNTVELIMIQSGAVDYVEWQEANR